MGIADGMKSITEGIIASHEARVREVNELVDNTQKTLRNFTSDRKHTGAGQAKALADYVETLRAEVGGMIKGFQKDHAAVAAGIRETLTHGEADRMKDFKGMMGNIQKGIKDIEAYVEDKLKEFNNAHAEMSEKQKKDLAKYVSGIVNEVKQLLGGYASEMAEARAAWQGMAGSLVKSAGAAPRAKAAKAVAVEPEETPVKMTGKKKGRKKKGKKNR